MEKRKNRIGKTLRGMFWIIAMTAIVVVLLALINWLPSLIEKDFAQSYDSIENAKQSLGSDYKIFVPAYFPEGISWPPSLILVQKKPSNAIVIEFKKAETMKTALIVIQSTSREGHIQLQRITMTELREETEYRLKGKIATLHVGTCDNGITCSRMTWQDRGLHFTVLLMSSPFELIKIAESMIH